MDISVFEKQLGVSNLKVYLINEIKVSRQEAELFTDNIIKEILNRIDNNIPVSVNLFSIISELIHLKKSIFFVETSEIHYYYKVYSFFNNSLLNSLNKTVDDDEKLVDFIFENFAFLKLPNYIISNRFKNFKRDFYSYYIRIYFEKKSILLFDKLNELNYLKDFIWNLDNLDKGILEFYKLLIIDKEKADANFKIEIEYIKDKGELKINRLEDEIKTKDREIRYKEGTIELYNDYHKKYLENYPTFINDTYFGDNQPFIFNLYNFLRKNLLINMMGWSYFYSCLSSNSNEIINLQSKNNLKFIGRILYCLQDFLQPKYKSDFHDFLKNKFYINEKPINDNFFKNHMRPIYDKSLYPNLNEIDDFFANQKNIYIKTNN